MNENEIKKDNKLLFIILIAIATIILGVLIYFVFIKNDDKKSNTNEVKDNSKTEEISINDYKVKELYSYISTDVKDDFWSYIDESKDKIIYTKDIDQDVKNKRAFYFLYLYEISTNEPCGENPIDFNYESIIKEFDSDYNCGFSNGETNTEKTNIINASDLERSVEKIFGKDSYTGASFKFLYLNAGYVYVSELEWYIYSSAPGGGTGRDNFESSLVSVSKKGNTISLNIKLDVEKMDSSPYVSNYKFIYYLDENGYYLYSIEKLV